MFTQSLELYSTLTRPECGQQTKDKMPSDSCQYYYECKSCNALSKPKPGDCCVYCSYGDVPCPQVQEGICYSNSE